MTLNEALTMFKSKFFDLYPEYDSVDMPVVIRDNSYHEIIIDLLDDDSNIDRFLRNIKNANVENIGICRYHNYPYINIAKRLMLSEDE